MERKEGVMKSILLVEDGKFLRLANERVLGKAGYKVVSVGDGNEALRVARDIVPDLILLDMMLPGLSGLDVLKALKNDPITAAVPVVILSGLSQTNELKLKKDGAAAYFEKSKMELEAGSEPLLKLVREVLAQTAPIAAVAE